MAAEHAAPRAPLERPRVWRLRRHVRPVLFGGLAILAVLGAAAGVLLHLRQLAIDGATRELNVLATLLGEQTARAVQGADLLLDSIDRRLAAAGGMPNAGTRAIHDLLRERIAGLPQVKYVTIIGPDGRLKASTFSFPALDVYLGDRQYFAGHVDVADQKARLIEPVRSRTTEEWLIMFSRRVENPDGSFGGVLNIALDPAYFLKLYEALSLSPGSAIALLRSDGMIVTRFPEAEAFIGHFADAGNMRRLDELSEGSAAEITSIVTGQRRFVIERRVSGYPLLVIASLDKAEVLTNWQRQLWWIGGGAFAAAAVIIALVAKLQASSMEAGRILDVAPDAMVLVDAAGLVVRVNARLENMFGYAAAELSGRPVDLLVPEEFRASHRHLRAGYAAAPQPRRMGSRDLDLFARRRDGSLFPVEISLNPLSMAGLDYVVATIRDISERRKAERELNTTAASLREAREMFAAIVDASPLSIIALDGERNVLVWNRAAEAVSGFLADEVIGHPYPLVPEEGEAEFDHYFQRALAGESLRAIEVTRRRKDGKLRQLVFSGEPLYDNDGRFRAVIYVLEDITERKAMEDQLRQAQKMEAVGQLTGGIAHDFNNMLTVIVGNAEVLLARSDRDPALRPLCEMILKAAEGSADLTSRLLAFARRQSLQPKRTEVNPFVERMGDLLKRTLGENVEIRLVLAKDAWEVMIDPSQLETAILNLAINARDAMPDGGQIVIETANVSFEDASAAAGGDVPVGNFVAIVVSDNGTGMSAETIRRAFEPFFTTKEIGKGTGLGLSMVYGFVRQSGGWVRIYSELGEGTSVKMYLPRAVGAMVKAPAVAAPAELAPARGESILVVEDEKLLREFVERQLRDLGYSVVVAGDGRTALDILSGDTRFDLLFTDIVMPGGMSGRELAERARALHPEMRILFTSAYTRDAVALHGRLDADAQVLSKPYRVGDLAAKVREVLDPAA